MAHELGPDAKFPPVLELRDEMGVSLGTLNSAMKVLEADNIIYRIQGVGVFVSPSLQRHVSLVCTPDFFQQSSSSPFWQLMVESAGERAKAKNEAFSCHFTVPGGHKGTPLHAGLAREIEARELHGVLGIGLDQETATWIEERGIPFVAFAGPGPWTVGLDTHRLIEMGVAELVSLGCKRLSSWNAGSSINRPIVIEAEIETDMKWRELVRAHGLEVHERWLRNKAHMNCVGVSHQEQGYDLAYEMFSEPRSTWPDGILCHDDMMTHGMLLALERLGVHVGIDVQIVSHSNRNSTVLMGREHLITRLEFDPAEIVRTMFDILETAMDGGSYEDKITEVRPTLHRPV
ncbi:MAG TPA: substrate-binding domain-containing protein [Abditibacteriaceae bacterium]|jgi:DNA-binding LacI/PurR family transcriptional regulator